MKKTLIFTAIASLVLASSCTERVDFPSLGGENVISLDLVYGEPATRADGDEPSTTPGEGKENAVTSVQYFIYNDVAADPVYNSGRITDMTAFSSTDLKYSVTLVAGEGGVPDLTTIFQNGTCTVFAVFNAPAALEAAPLEDVKATAVANAFTHEADEAGAATRSKWVVTPDTDPDHDKYFVMTGELELSRAAASAAYAAKGTVEMNRIAAKIAVDLVIAKSVTATDGNIWVPMLGGPQVRIYLQNAVKNAVIGGASETPAYPETPDYFTYKDISLDTELTKPEGETVKVTETTTSYVVASQLDFYTYPVEWTRGDNMEPFIKVILPWRETTGATSQKEVYYKIMLPTTKFEANKYYKYTVNLSVLGNEGEPQVELKPLSAMVVGWQGGGSVNGTMSAAKYLSVERGVKTPVDFYTPTSGTPYAASDPVTVTIKEIKQQNLKTGNFEYLFQNYTANASEITKRGFTEATIRSTWVTNTNSYLEIGHQLNSDLTSALMDVTPYYYTVELSLPTEIDPNGEYTKTVNFVQWPEVYVVADRNSNTPATASQATSGNQGIYINGNNTTNTTWYKGEYNTWESSHSSYDLGGANGISNNASNRNPNMYVLTVSVSSSYIIGDPRTKDVSMPEFRYRAISRQWVGGLFSGHYEYTYGDWTDNWAPGKWTEDASVSNHVLTYYHPTSSENTANMIAPKIRIASSYGVCGVGGNGEPGRTQEEAILRCASYQEDGIPAGRWRLPTMAEVKFISALSALGRIPYLFGSSTNNGQTARDSDDYYWTANGLILVNNGTSTATEASGTNYLNKSVRCVYDEWFWGDATTRPVQKTQFTWGDRNY